MCEAFTTDVFLGSLRIFQNSRRSRPKLKKTCNFIKKRLQHRCFPVNFANICERLLLKKLAILKNTSEQLLLTLLLNSKNLLTSYEQLSYYQFNIKQIKTLVFYKEKIDSMNKKMFKF